ncbi:MAG: GTP 3',8-cyclase MoaA, partial [Pseudomonadota bacterium]|nr:GTP 3',8-cyclase MoaA [Pseudomonadota bacterium]
SHAFCRACTRARLSTEGKLYLCLFAGLGHDLRTLLRGSELQPAATDSQLEAAIGHIWRARDDRYSELRGPLTVLVPKVEMSYIGG